MRFVILFVVIGILLTMVAAETTAEETAVDSNITTTLLEWWQKPADLAASCADMDLMSIKLAFYNAEGPFSFLNSGDCWCPNMLLRPWCDDFAIP